MFKTCKDKIMQQANKENMSINEAMFTTTQKSTYSVGEAQAATREHAFQW